MPIEAQRQNHIKQTWTEKHVSKKLNLTGQNNQIGSVSRTYMMHGKLFMHTHCFGHSSQHQQIFNANIVKANTQTQAQKLCTQYSQDSQFTYRKCKNLNQKSAPELLCFPIEIGI